MEKAQQIPLMTQIFRNAKKVLAWVGGGAEEEQGMQQLSALSRNSREAVELQMRSNSDSITTQQPSPADFSIPRFLNLSWFSRLWVNQEVVFNNDIDLLCCNTELTWSRLVAGLVVLSKARPEIANRVDPGKVEALLSIAQLWRHHCMIDEPKDSSVERDDDALAIVGKFWNYNCSDARDRIYALYSMIWDISPTERSRVEESYPQRVYPPFRIYLDIDCSLDVRTTYHIFAMACIRSGRVTDVLNAVLARQFSLDAEDWPSWVPDWGKPPSSAYIKPAWVGSALGPVGSAIHPISCNPAPPNILSVELNRYCTAHPDTPLPPVSRKIHCAQSGEAFLKSLHTLSMEYPLSILIPMLRSLLDPWRTTVRDSHIHNITQYFGNAELLPSDFFTSALSDTTEKLQMAMQNLCFFIASPPAPQESWTEYSRASFIGYGTVAMQLGDELKVFEKEDLIQEFDMDPADTSALLLRRVRKPSEPALDGQVSYRLIGSAYVSAPCLDGKRLPPSLPRTGYVKVSRTTVLLE